MHQLILLRHAKAAAPDADGSDHDRALTEAGRAAAARIGRAMRLAGLAPDVVLVSPSLRTQQTFAELESAGVWAEWPNVESLPALYMATPNQMRDILHDLPETVRSAMIIGHNPGLHELARKLTGTAAQQRDLARLTEGYPTATLTEFLITTPWRRVGVNTASLQRFLAAKDLA
jgi:phosphohistidine phosphatase